ncbi:putative sodium/calcium exchange protein [Actinobacillus equuli]|nr:putative sodium/calcium exchange protein [Actinobacillus equuli]
MVTLVSAYMLFDAQVTQLEAVILLVIFTLYMGWTIWVGVRNKDDALAQTESLQTEQLPLKKHSFGL